MPFTSRSSNERWERLTSNGLLISISSSFSSNPQVTATMHAILNDLNLEDVSFFSALSVEV
jgi:hypothetical protein